MLELFFNHIEPILTFVLGGGIVSLVKWRSIKKQAEADAMKAVQDVYQETIRDLREDKEMIKKDNAELREIVLELDRTVLQITKDVSVLKQFKCIVTDCKLRITE